MSERCLICNEILLEKLEYFIYDYSDIEYNNLNINVNHFSGNHTDWDELKNKNNIYQLRKLLSYHNSDIHLKENELENAIDIFLLFLRTYNFEASMCLDALLDAIWETGETGREWKCVKRTTGILASMYLLYYGDKPTLLDKNKTEDIMKAVFQKNIKFYTENDLHFLIQTFMVEKQFDCLIDLLDSYLVGLDKIEGYTIESQYNMANIFFKLLHKLESVKKYNDAMTLLEKSKSLFGSMIDNELQKHWEKHKANLFFRLKKYEDAKSIQDKYIVNYKQSKNVYDLYNGAIDYAWAANFKEKDDPIWKEYIEKAYQLILQAENVIMQTDTETKEKNKEILNYVILEKAFLLSEKNDHNAAFNCFHEVFFNANKETIKDSNFSTHLWILMNYMCLNPEKREIVINLIENFYNEFSYRRLNEYEVVVDFIHSNEYLKNNIKIRTDIYSKLLELLFHALEIRHETKIRDVSQYDILYYTKADHLRLLLEDENSETHYRLPLFHACHMNDPQEGNILQNLLETEKIINDNTTETSKSRYQYKENYVFLKSFFCYRKDNKQSKTKEYLPMWVQYGDDAKGCCVLLNSKTFEYSSLRRIIYLSDNGECDNKDYKVGLLLKKFISSYKDLTTYCNCELDISSKSGKEFLLQIKPVIDYIISQISYLFKSDSYKHENEVRLIVNRTKDELDDAKVIAGAIPKLYIYNNRQTYIDEIILGSKIDNPEDYVPFIYKQGNKMWNYNSNAEIKVTQSIIQYR